MSTQTRQRAVLILGAGRSGTSIVARASQAIGIDLGDDFKPASRKNPTGFFEDAELLRLSKKLRRALGLRPDSLRLLDDDIWESSIVTPFYQAFEDCIQSRFRQSPVWGFKYARTMRLLPFWVNLFERMGVEAAYIMPIRNPLSVARSRAKLDGHRGRQENSDLEWLVNVIPYFNRVKGSPIVLVDYDKLMQNPTEQLGRMSRTLNLSTNETIHRQIHEFTDQFLKPKLQHTHFSMDQLASDSRIHPLIKQFYPLLQQLADDSLDIESEYLWQSWQEISEEVEALRPLLSTIDHLNDRLRLARWNPISFIPMSLEMIRKVYRTI